MSYIEKGTLYRQKIISEVSPKAVTLMKAVSVRDYAGNCLFEDEKVRLYYTIRVVQDYLKEERVNKQELKKLPQELQTLIYESPEKLITLYKKARYSVVDQEIKRNPSFKEFRDFLELLKLGHYDVSETQISQAIDYYNNYPECSEKISHLKEVAPEIGQDVERRLTDRIIQIKPMKRLQQPSKPLSEETIAYSLAG